MYNYYIAFLCVYSGDISYTLWTQWKIKGNDKMTLKQFLEVVKVHSKCYRPHSIPFTLFSIAVRVWSRTHYRCVRGEDDLCSNNA